MSSTPQSSHRYCSPGHHSLCLATSLRDHRWPRQQRTHTLHTWTKTPSAPQNFLSDLLHKLRLQAACPSRGGLFLKNRSHNRRALDGSPHGPVCVRSKKHPEVCRQKPLDVCSKDGKLIFQNHEPDGKNKSSHETPSTAPSSIFFFSFRNAPVGSYKGVVQKGAPTVGRPVDVFVRPARLR